MTTIKQLFFGNKNAKSAYENPVDDKKLESQQWYHGIRTREECAPDLIEKGDFLVRASSTPKATNLVLNVLSRTLPYPRNNPLDGVSNYTIIVSKTTKRFVLHKALDDYQKNPSTARPAPEFDNCVDLVEYYKMHSLPCGARLKRAMERPQYLIKHSAILYDPISDYLNGGNFGQVYKGTFTTRKGKVCKAAIKVCKCDNPENMLNARISMMRESKLMSEYSHENVITFYGVACDHPPVTLVMELCLGGSLEDHLLHDRDDIVVERVNYCYEAARGMRYLHAQGCIHSDLASRNCLISTDGIIKICDFGLSKFVDEEKNMKNAKIPIRWCAPEFFTQKTVVQKSDVWSYGVLVYEVFNKGGIPWPGETDWKLMRKRICSGDMLDLPDVTPKTVVALVQKCWTVDYEKRISFDEIYLFLSDYLVAHCSEFPPVSQLAVNKIKGVNRKSTFREDPPDLKQMYKTAKHQSRSSTAPESTENDRIERHEKKKKRRDRTERTEGSVYCPIKTKKSVKKLRTMKTMKSGREE